jgi:hypothetical protein
MRHLILALALLFGLANSDAPTIDQLYEQKDFEAAFDLATQQASEGDAQAHAWLGQFYEMGEGTQKDLIQAASHYRIGAFGGQNYARWRLGVMIDQGDAEGTLEEAVMLFQTAASEDYSNAVVSLAVMQALGRGTPEDDPAALANYRRAADLGNLSGLLGYGLMTAYGEGVEADEDEGAAWVLLASFLGLERADEYLADLAVGWPEDRIARVSSRAVDIRDELLPNWVE